VRVIVVIIQIIIIVVTEMMGKKCVGKQNVSL